MEDPLNKKKSSHPSLQEGQQIRFRPKQDISSEELRGQDVLKDILTHENMDTTTQWSEDFFQIPFEEFGRSFTETVDLESISSNPQPSMEKEVKSEKQEISDVPNSSLLDDVTEESGQKIEEPDQIRFQAVDENSVSKGLSPDTENLEVGTAEMPSEVGSAVSDQQIVTYQETDPSSSIFRLKEGTRRAFGVLKDIFGDVENDPGKESHEISPSSTRKKLPAILICLVFGIFGAHRLYLGHYKRTPAYLLILGFSWMSWEFLPDLGLGNLLIVTIVLWVIADALALIFSRRITDDKGHVLREWV